jgi:hypothetical protein
MQTVCSALLVLWVGMGCANSSEAEHRLEAIRQAYSAAIKVDFKTSLHGADVDRVLKALDGFSGPEQVRFEAGELADRIRRTRARNPVQVEQLDRSDLFNSEGEEALPELASADPDEAIWMKALRVGAFRADFERYWLGCFQPMGEQGDRWRVLDVPPCRRRPGLDRIAEVRFKNGQISALVTHKQLIQAAKP